MPIKRLKQVSYVTCVMDLNFSSFSINKVKSSNDFFKHVKSILCQYDSSRDTYILEPDWSEHKSVKYEIENSEQTYFQPKVGEVQIFQMNIAKKGSIDFEFDPKAGLLTFHQIEVGGRYALDQITQNGEDIDFEITDYGRPNEELLMYVVKNKDGSIDTDFVDAYFSYSDDEDQEFEELDSKLLEITNDWYKELFKK